MLKYLITNLLFFIFNVNAGNYISANEPTLAHASSYTISSTQIPYMNGQKCYDYCNSITSDYFGIFW